MPCARLNPISLPLSLKLTLFSWEASDHANLTVDAVRKRIIMANGALCVKEWINGKSLLFQWMLLWSHALLVSSFARISGACDEEQKFDNLGIMYQLYLLINLDILGSVGF